MFTLDLAVIIQTPSISGSAIGGQLSTFGRFALGSSFTLVNFLDSSNRLYIGVFGLLMFPVLLAAIIGFVLCFVAAPPVDIDGIREPVAGSLLYGNNIVSGALILMAWFTALHSAYNFRNRCKRFTVVVLFSEPFVGTTDLASISFCRCGRCFWWQSV